MLMQTHEARLDALRKELARRGLDGFVVTRERAQGGTAQHQSHQPALHLAR